MFRVIFFAFIILKLYFNTTEARKGYGPGEQDWGYINVRQGAHIFYWLYYTTATTNYTERPLVIWLQGGPGQSSTGIGNFKEIGPIDVNGKQRNQTWVNDVNVLFIDSPVGSGFSYIDSDGYLATSSQRTAMDLMAFIKVFYEKYIDFENVPLHIFGESHGAKVAARFALNLYHAIEKLEISCNLQSVVLISPAISMKESAMMYAPYLLHMDMIDSTGYNKIVNVTSEIKMLIKARKWKESFGLWNKALDIMLTESGSFDFNNVLTPLQVTSDTNTSLIADKLTQLMRGRVSRKLSIPTNIKWGSHFDMTYENLSIDIMIPAIHIVSELLERTELQVGVISGQLDSVTPSLGTYKWISKLKWSYKNEYLSAARKLIYIDRIVEGYEKTARKLFTFSIKRAGHMIAADNPKAMKYILHKIINYD